MKNITIDERFCTPELYFIAKFPILIGTDILLLPLSSIIFIESDGSYSKINSYDNSSVLYTSKSLKYYEERLPAHSFLRVHNQFIVNLHYIKFIRRGSHWKIELLNKFLLNISDDKKEILIKTLGLNYE